MAHKLALLGRRTLNWLNCTFFVALPRYKFKTRNSAIADKSRDALVQYAMAWLPPP